MLVSCDFGESPLNGMLKCNADRIDEAWKRKVEVEG